MKIKKLFSRKNVHLLVKSESQIIQEIHDSFYSEVDKLLANAKITKSLDTDKADLIAKRDRLVKLGFSSTQEVKEAEIEINRLDALKAENEDKASMVRAIEYFSVKYPVYKFITEDSVRKICEKYNLVYGAVSKYIGTVPDKNLKQLEAFKIDAEDECWQSILVTPFSEIIANSSFIKKRRLEAEEALERRHYSRFTMHHRNVIRKSPMEICAPLKEFNMTNKEVVNFKLTSIVIKDPVVLQPVFFENQKYYLIVTAWGTEASDELVVNQKMN